MLSFMLDSLTIYCFPCKLLYYPILNTSSGVTKCIPGHCPGNSRQIEKYVFKNTSDICLMGILTELWTKAGGLSQHLRPVIIFFNDDFCPGQRFEEKRLVSLKCVKERTCLKFFLLLSA